MRPKAGFKAKRLFILEPGLRELHGHPLQYALALQDYGYRRELSVHVVTHKNIERRVLKFLRSALPILEHACFPVTSDGPKTFCAALTYLNRQYELNQNDLLIVTSCYMNELEGISLFQNARRAQADLPNIAINFHQILPPSSEATLMCTREYQSLWHNRLRKAFNALPAECPALSYWTTVSDQLSAALQKVSGRPVGTLPFLFADCEAPRKPSLNNEGLMSQKRQKFAFLGDGRQEKGLLYLLRAIQELIPAERNLSFVIHLINPRGYGASEREELLQAVRAARHRQDIEFMTEALPPCDFHALLSSVDAVVLPYDPRHYDRRASMIFIQAAMHQKPTIVSDGTWMAAEIRKGRASGIIFRFPLGDGNAGVKPLARAIRKLHHNISTYSSGAKLKSSDLKQIHSADRYIDAISNHLFNQRFRQVPVPVRSRRGHIGRLKRSAD